MPWFALTGDERIRDRCASEGCAGQPTWRLEAGGVGSVYCSGCKAQIDKQEKHADHVAAEEKMRAYQRNL